MTTVLPDPPGDRSGLLPSELKVLLWRKVDARLRNGEVLITNEQFYQVLAREFRRLVGVAPDRRVKLALLEMILQVNEKHPETYLSAGIKNAVNQFLKASGENAGETREMIKRMVREGRTAMWLESLGIDVDARTLSGRVERAIISIVEGKRLRSSPRREIRRRRARRNVAFAEVRKTTAEEAPVAEEPSAYGADPSQAEQQQREAEDRQRAEELAEEELVRAPRNLEAYRQQKLLTDEEVADLKKLYGIEKRLADGDIDDEEANRLREEISATVREKLQERMRGAVDHAVQYLNVFEALRRIPGDRDAAVRFLIKHKNQVVAEDAETINLSVVTKTLEDDSELLDELGTLMERKDHEMRMMAANMPPYRHIYTPDQTIGKFTITEDFVDFLRQAQREEVSDRLNSEDGEVRLKTAADLKCAVALLTSVMKTTTPFHKEARRLRIVLRMKHLFEGAISEKDGRNRVQQFLRRRLRSLYPDLSREERAVIESIGQKIMDKVSLSDDDEDNTKRVYRV